MCSAMTDKRTCSTCKHIDKTSYRYYYCTVAKTEIDGDEMAFLARVGCTSHSDFRNARNAVLDKLRDRLDTIRRSTEPHNVISFRTVHQMIDSFREDDEE